MSRNGKKFRPSSSSAGEREDEPSKSAKKRESTALQKLGEELASLSPAERAELDLPSDLQEALAMHDRIKDHEGARRQRQYIGKLMRAIDATPIAKSLAIRKNLKSRQVAAFHYAEKCRDAILEAETKNLDAILADIAAKLSGEGVTAEQLSSLAREARAASSAGEEERKKKSRELFRYIANGHMN